MDNIKTSNKSWGPMSLVPFHLMNIPLVHGLLCTAGATVHRNHPELQHLHEDGNPLLKCNLIKSAGSIISKLFIWTQQLYNEKEIHCSETAEKAGLENYPRHYITEVHGGVGFFWYFKIPNSKATVIETAKAAIDVHRNKNKSVRQRLLKASLYIHVQQSSCCSDFSLMEAHWIAQ